MLGSFGWQELLIVLIILLINFGVPVAMVVAAVIVSRHQPPTPMQPPSRSDIRCWSIGRVRLLLLGTAAPLVAGPLLFAIGMLSSVVAPDVLSADFMEVPLVIAVMAVGVLSSMGLLALMVIYTLIAIRSSLPDAGKAMWIVTIVMGGFFTLPFAFHYLVTVPRRTPLPAVTNRTLT